MLKGKKPKSCVMKGARDLMYNKSFRSFLVASKHGSILSNPTVGEPNNHVSRPNPMKIVCALSHHGYERSVSTSTI
jgi:hypothetical protein